ncbi:CIC11C00000004386 [Sungouiella intermedia]|uniref:CIC11C00000004386 n=1 Tax=Sungouiella intermedia TaxID=45354 RepID=A0A1L0CW60_9ASCO|nr:CIC11C00000004386 [[Candida] intermedia]
MKFSTLALSGMAAVASAETYSLAAQSADGSISSPLTGFHEGAGFSYFAVAGPGTELTWRDGTLGEDVGNGAIFSVNYFENYLSFGILSEPAQLTFDKDNTLVSNETFWACNNLNDPYNYSKNTKLIVFGEDKVNDSCVEVKIKLVEFSSSSSAEASSTTEASSSAEATSTLVTLTTSTAVPAVTSAEGGAVKNSAGIAALAGLAAMML